MKSTVALTESSTLETITRPQVTLSRWVNETCPPWNDLLSARDVARLTRRHKWVVIGMSWCGLFPKPHRFRGKRVGWLKADVMEALTGNLHVSECRVGPGSRKRHPRQACLPLECQMPCAKRRRSTAVMELPKTSADVRDSR